MNWYIKLFLFLRDAIDFIPWQDFRRIRFVLFKVIIKVFRFRKINVFFIWFIILLKKVWPLDLITGSLALQSFLKSLFRSFISLGILSVIHVKFVKIISFFVSVFKGVCLSNKFCSVYKKFPQLISLSLEERHCIFQFISFNSFQNSSAL